MEPQTVIPLAETSAEVAALIATDYRGVTNIKLTNNVVNYILTLLHNQRHPVKSAVDSYVHSILKHGYDGGLQLVHIGELGNFADGQHRFLALKKVYELQPDFTPPWQLVMFGISKDRIKDLDNGTPRRTKDVLRMCGKCQNSVIASALSVFVKLIVGCSRRKILSRELEEYWDDGFCEIENIGNFPALKNIVLLNQHAYYPPSWVVVCFYISYRTYGLQTISKAYEEFYNGTDSTLPMVRFREWLIANRKEVSRLNVYSHEEIKKTFGYFFFAIKKYVEGLRITNIRSTKLGTTILGRDF